MLFVFGCAADQKDHHAVEVVLMQRQQALCKKDLNRYRSLLSLDYLDKNQNYTLKTNELESNFAVFDKIDYRSDGYKIHIKDAQGTVSGHYRMKITIGHREMKMEGEENLLLRKESGGWKIVAGL